MFNGLANDKAWKFGTYGSEMQNNLFGETENGTFTAVDLLATNLQRGRDHGLPPYIDYVYKCHGVNVTKFNDLTFIMRTPKIQTLEKLYE